MSITQQVQDSVDDILTVAWNMRHGQVVPKTADVVLRNGAVEIEAAYLYADLAGSSGIAHKLTKEAAAKIVRSYLNAASRLIRFYGGEIRSFDGDRVMGIYVGTSRDTMAVRTALAINWAVRQVLAPKFKAYWDGQLERHYAVDHGVGVATGSAMVVRGGVRDNNDLVSIGAAPNVAAKLSELRGYASLYITSEVYEAMADGVAFTPDAKRMWQPAMSQTIGGVPYRVLSSSYWWEP